MSALDHSPAYVLSKALTALALTVEPPAEPWPSYATKEPDLPDDCVTVYNTQGRDNGRIMISGERVEQHGIQIRVRCQDPTEGYTKANEIATSLDEDLYALHLTVGAHTYLIHCFNRTGDIIDLGEERPNSARSVYTFNGLLVIKKTT